GLCPRAGLTSTKNAKRRHPPMRLASALALRSLSSGDMGLIRSRQGILVRVVLSSLFGSEKSTNFNLATVRLNPTPLPRNGERGQDRVFRKGEGNRQNVKRKGH